MITCWIWPENLKPLIVELERVAGETLDEGVRFLLLDEVSKSAIDAPTPRWAQETLEGANPINLKLGLDSGGMLIVEVDAPSECVARIEVMLDLMQAYTLNPRN